MADQRTLVVVGTGAVTGAPDQCVLQLALNGIGATPAESLGICSTAAEGAIAALEGAGVVRDDIRTVNLSVQDFFDQAQQKVTARIGSYELEVIVRNVDDVSGLLGVLSDAAGDALQIRSLLLGMRDAGPLFREARRQAVRDAQEKARDLAEAAELQLGSIQSLEDNERPGSPFPARSMHALAASAMPIEPGQTSVRASVTITYAIAGRHP